MNGTGFKRSIAWMNIGEVSVVSGSYGVSVSDSALFGVSARRRRSSFPRHKF